MLFPIIPDYVLRWIFYCGTIAGFFVAFGGLAGIELTRRFDVALQEMTKKLIDTQKALSVRTLTSFQVQELRSSIEECWKGVNVQRSDFNDLESLSFAMSLKSDFDDAGFETFPYELPTLSENGGSDMTIYLPRATGKDWFEVVQNSSMYKNLRNFGFNVGAVSSATKLTRHEVVSVTDEQKYLVYPDYCIILVHPRPPPRLLDSPYMGRPKQPLSAN